ncbi:MAG: helicase SNF2 [Candidatus Marinimicrobia bacterium]|nr:helicase SNF2 [Candidatus Neomarinimicrobiota bacterium]
MSSRIFGTTWWGKAWLDALKKIDYANKLDQGVQYAESGAVSDIEIDNNIIRAKVQDENRMTPYHISLEFSEFDEYDMAQIEKTIESNHYYISKLESKVLPPTLLEELEDELISLFPKSFQEIKMTCGCTKHAHPCKHVSALFFIMTNEIDKNPFIIFSLHGFNLLNITNPQDTEFDTASKIPTTESFLTGQIVSDATNSAISIVNTKKLQDIDFSVIPDLNKKIDKLLTPFPLFYTEGDFKKKMIAQYDLLQKKVTGFIKKSEFTETPDTHYYSLKIKIINNSYDFEGRLFGYKDIKLFNLDEMEDFIDFLQNHTLNNISKHSLEIKYISQIYSFTLKLIQQCAYIPEIFSTSKDEFMVRWIPAIFDKKINEIVQVLCDNIPSDIVIYKNQQMSKKDQVFFLITFFISYFQKYFDLLPKRGSVQILSLFYNFDVFTQVKFEDQQIPNTIHLWLSRFYITTGDCIPVIKIDESSRHGDRVLFEILVSDKNDPADQLIPLRNFITRNHPEKNRILKDLSLLSAYLPQVNEFLQLKSGNSYITILSDEFVGVWFDALPILKTLGVQTILPKSLKKVFSPSLSLSFDVKQDVDYNAISFFNINSMLDFKWNIAIGTSFITPEEFRKLLDKYSGIVKLKDSYVYIDEKEAKKILKQMEKEPELTKNDLLKINLEKKFRGVPINATTEVHNLFDKMFTRYDPAIPSGLKARLRPYQVKGYKWLYNNMKSGLGSLMADDMGLGKTIQVITLILKLKEEKILPINKCLIIVPATLLSNWQHEFEKFAPDIRFLIYHGQRRKYDISEFDVVITTYSLARSENATFQKSRWILLITDETQNIKNPSSNQTWAIKSIKADTKIAMTGTPVENRLMDYWSILDFIMKKFVGSQATFRENFATPIERFRNQVKLEDFRKITAPFILRREKTDKSIINDLPDKIEIEKYNQLTPEQTALYQEVINSAEDQLLEAKGIARKGIIFKLFTNLKQICNHPSHYLGKKFGKIEHSGKSALLMELLQQILSMDEKVLIFTQYTKMGAILSTMVEEKFNMEPLFLHGGLTRKKRDNIIEVFQQDNSQQILILSLKAGGTGLNLTAANNVIHYDLWWNPAVENQATDRAFRIGQKNNVTIYRMITKGTFEEKINDMLQKKKELADLTINVGEKWITEMSNDELKQLVSISNQ